MSEQPQPHAEIAALIPVTLIPVTIMEQLALMIREPELHPADWRYLAQLIGEALTAETQARKGFEAQCYVYSQELADAADALERETQARQQAERELNLATDAVAALNDAKLQAERARDSLRTACEAFLAKWTLVLPAINSAFLMQHIHGQSYDGPTIGEEVDAIAAALRASAGPSQSEGKTDGDA